MATKHMTTRERDKAIAAVQNGVVFDVVGSGSFPVDMLRYDRCWPESQSDVSVAFSGGVTERRVQMRGLLPPTEQRWASFGWRVVAKTKSYALR